MRCGPATILRSAVTPFWPVRDVSQLEQHEVALAAVERRLAVAEARCAASRRD